MSSSGFIFVLSLLVAGVSGGSQSNTSAHCGNKFTAGRENFVLDTDESIRDGAAFLSSPSAADGDACAAACCAHPACNLALVEAAEQPQSASSCFLFNCLYKQKYVCRFIHRQNFRNYILSSVYEQHLTERTTVSADEHRPPVANPGPDVVVQPHEEVMLNGIESWDHKKIINYTWTLVRGDKSAVMEKTNLRDQMRVSGLIPGVYVFRLTVTDSRHRSDSAQITVLVLTAEQSERHCLTPKKVGPCRGSFPRWHYNAASGKCEKFMFGGCKENSNNYLSEKECLNACKNTNVTVRSDGRKLLNEDCSSACGDDQFKCSNGCCVKKDFECDGQTQCSDGSDEKNCNKFDESLSRLFVIKDEKAHCTESPATGPCRASFTRWFYNPTSRKCHRFTYGGCDGNDNNFKNKDDCATNCSGVTESDMFASGLHNVGGEEDDELGESQSASVALAVVLVMAAAVILAALGYCFLRNRRKTHHQPVATSPPVTYSEDDQQLVYSSTTTKA